MRPFFTFVFLCVAALFVPSACSNNNNNNNNTKQEKPTSEKTSEKTSENAAETTPETTQDGGDVDETPKETQEEPIPETTFEPNPNVGKIRWSTEFSGEVKSPALSADETVLYITSPNTLAALDPTDGSEKWRMSNLGKTLSSPVVDEQGNILVGSENKTIYAVHPTRKQWVWSFSVDSPADVNPPALGKDGRVYIAAGKTLYAVKNGKAAWTQQAKLNDEATSPPTVSDDGIIYVCSKDGSFTAIDSDGKTKWTKNIGKEPCRGAAIDGDGTVYVGGSQLYAFKPDGDVKWDPKKEFGTITTKVTIHQQYIYFGAYNGKLYKVDKRTGKKAPGPRWGDGLSILISDSLDYAPTIGASGFIYLGDSRPSLEGYNPTTAKPKWSLGGISRSAFRGYPAIAKDGTLYLGTEGGTLFAVWTESPGLANSPWPRGLQNNQSTSQLP